MVLYIYNFQFFMPLKQSFNRGLTKDIIFKNIPLLNLEILKKWKFFNRCKQNMLFKNTFFQELRKTLIALVKH